MSIKPDILAICRCLISLFGASLSASVLAQAQGSFASSDASHAGDHFRAQTHIPGFTESGPESATKRCAPAGSGMRIVSDTNEAMVVHFYDIPELTEQEKREMGERTAAGKTCITQGFVSTEATYIMKKPELNTHYFKRSGVVFGALVIPFKFRLGGDRAVTASSTVAPYIGFTSRYLQWFGVTLNPVVTAGVGLVPVANPAGDSPETKTALSFGAGFVVKSSKNDQFSAGMMIGRDVLNSADRARDPNVNKPWLSFYLGVAM